MLRLTPHLIALLMVTLATSAAHAADEEIEIYTDSVNAKHELGLDVHMNYVARGDAGADYAGGEPSLHRIRITPEFTFGLGNGLEIGAYLPLATIANDGVLRAQGEIVRLKWIAPHKDGEGFFWGGNFEIGRASARLDQNPWNAEIKGIAGLHKGPWIVALNANFNFKVDGPEPAPATITILSKVQYRLSPKWAVGIENYNGLGEVKALGPLRDQDHASYVTVDTKVAKWHLHTGIGVGYGGNKDALIFKLGIGVPLPQL